MALLACPAAVADQVDAIWVGGTGNWGDAANWSPDTVPNNAGDTTYNVFIDDGDVMTLSAVSLSLNATIDSLSLDAGDTLTLPNIRILTIAAGPMSGLLTNAGQIQLNSTGNFTDIRFSTDLVTLTGGGVISLSNNANNRLMGTNGGSMLNVDNTIRGAGQIGVNATAITNQGLIVADQPLALVIDPSSSPFVNEATLRAEAGGTLRLSNGNFNNAGGLIEALGGSLVELSSVVIAGGMLSTSDDGIIRAVSVCTLDSTVSALTNAGRLESTNGVDIVLRGNLANTGEVALIAGGTATELELHDAALELSGGGSILMGNNVNNRITGVNGGSLVNVDNTIRGSGQIGVNTMTLSNDGLIVADQSIALTIDPLVTMTNTGTLRAELGGTLRLVSGAFENATGVIEALAGSVVEINAGAINGGILQTSGDGVIRSVASGELNGNVNPIMLDGEFAVVNNANVALRGTIENSGLITLNSTGLSTDLRPTDGVVTLTGGGSLNLSSNVNNRILGATGGLLVNMDNSIRGAGQIGANTLDITNGGLIVADQTANLTIDPAVAALVNTGTLRAEAGATLRLTNGSFENAGGLIEALAGSTVELNNAAISGGELSTQDNGRVRVVAGATLAGAPGTLTNSGRIELANDADVTLTGTISNSGMIEIASTGSFTDLEPTNGPVTLTGGGQINMSNHLNNRILGVTGGSLINADNAISGAGQIGLNVMPITNQGSITANQAIALTINPDNTIGLDNQGQLRAAAGATMNISDGPFTTSGSIIVDSGCTISRTGGIAQTAGVMTVNGSLSATAPIVIDGGLVHGDGAITGSLTNGGAVGPGEDIGQLSISGSYTQSATGTLEIDIGGLMPITQHDVLSVGGPASLDGTLRIRFVNGFVPSIGQSFTIMTYPSRTGAFSMIDVPCAGVSVSVNATSVVAEVVSGVAVLGDMNCDCVADLADIGPFVTALIDPGAYTGAYPDCDLSRADIFADLVIDARDIQPFIDLLLP